jgi:hypothetical protein
MPLAGPSLRLPTAIHQAGHSLRELSPSPDFPALLLPPPALGRARAPDTTGAAPVPLVPSARKPAPLKITTQLNETWMAASGGPRVVPPSSQSVVMRPSTFHTKRPVARRPVVDARQIRRFTAVFIDNVRSSPSQVFRFCY